MSHDVNKVFHKKRIIILDTRVKKRHCFSSKNKPFLALAWQERCDRVNFNEGILTTAGPYMSS
jgi:hypothetical protein